uniref:dihydrofolate reductase n=1 Tax=Glossina pallidipes TaxID=7398 RepID=A0A1A9Z854_GLOPL
MSKTSGVGTDSDATYNIQHGKVDTIGNDEGNRTSPSYETERPIEDATHNQVAMNSQNTKHSIDHKSDDPGVQANMKHGPLDIHDVQSKPEIEQICRDEKKTFLSKTKERTGVDLDKSDINAVVTDSSRQAIKNGGTIAGLKFNLIVAVSKNLGIGLKGGLPWKLKSELKYFSQTTKRVLDPTKRNVVIMGRKTYFGIPPSNRPLRDRLNIVLSTTLTKHDLPDEVLLQPNLEAAMKFFENNNVLKNSIETVWIIGGAGVFKDAMASERCHRLYITQIQSNFECDVFLPTIPDDFQEVITEPEIPQGMQAENGINFVYKVFEKR